MSADPGVRVLPPQWALAVLLASLAAIGPFAIDTYLPAFAGIAASISANDAQMQQTLSVYLICFAAANLFHGPLSDRFGRRPVILAGLAVFGISAVGCALATSIETLVFWRAVQGVSAGAGTVIARTIIRDLFPPAQAQRVMSQVTMIFGIAPAIAPLIGGWLFVGLGWQAIFWFLCAYASLLGLAIWRILPEPLPVERRQSIAIGPLLAAYRRLLSDRRFLLLALASGVPFNAFFIYILSAPAFLGQVLGLPPQRFFLLFIFSIAGIMIGAWVSGRLAGRIRPRRQILIGFTLMACVSSLNVLANLIFPPHPGWSLLPILFISMGWALLMPAITLLLLDLFPERRGMASSLQAVTSSVSSALVAGILSPWVMHSASELALASASLTAMGMLCWAGVRFQSSHGADPSPTA
jgi:DHA1 family bicyclomycin/chloramphenicol resistance-like MFS transporter